MMATTNTNMRHHTRCMIIFIFCFNLWSNCLSSWSFSQAFIPPHSSKSSLIGAGQSLHPSLCLLPSCTSSSIGYSIPRGKTTSSTSADDESRKKRRRSILITQLDAFNQRGYNKFGDYDSNDKNDDDNEEDIDEDEDDDDDEPPEISISPQEFLHRMQQKQNNSGNDDDATPVASYGPGRGRSAPQIRPAFGAKKSNSSSSQLSSKIKSGSRKEGKGGSSSSKNDIATVYVCTNCGSEYVQWRGRCGTCMEWNTIQEYQAQRKPSTGSGGGKGMSMRAVFGKSTSSSSSSGSSPSFQKSGSSWLDGISNDNSFSGDNNIGGGAGGPVRVTDVYQEILKDTDMSDDSSSWQNAYLNGSREHRTNIPNDPELNSVLGGGLMPGSICLVGGDPGVGKSTLMLQMAGSVASMSERSMVFQGVGMGPPVPSPSTTTALNDESVDKSGKDDTDAQQKTSSNNQQQTNGGGAGSGPVVYISGEENANQIASRALRLGIVDPELLLWCETDADVIADAVVNSMYNGFDDDLSAFDNDDGNANRPPMSRSPSLVIIDSIQTMVCDAAGSSAAGGITQVRECVGLFLRLAKSTGVPIMLVGHVTKSGDVAGPRTVEHMVDCVLYLEGGALLGSGGGGGAGADSASGGGVSSLRILRAAKNRFGSSDEVGVYEMGQGGRLVPISDPSSFFLATRLDNIDAEGCAISVVLEGIRSMTVEVQALVAFSAGSGGYSGRRIVDGVSNSRLLLILAVLQKRYGISFHRRDVYVNVVGGMHLGKGSKSGGGSDLAVAVAVVSSLLGIPVRSDTTFVGEVGLLGELRPVHSLEKRIGEARRMGFSRIVTPSSNQKSKRNNASFGPKEVSAGGIKQLMCDNVLDAINCGLVMKLPVRQTRSGPKLIKPKGRPRNSRARSNEEELTGMDELDIILDDEEDDVFE